MSYMDLINEPEFKLLLKKYMNDEIQNIDYNEYFKHFIDNMENGEIYIPVLGIQGAGKSSFLNSLLMEENILPTDVDETTCVPVEVRYGKDESHADIYFKFKDAEKIDICDLEKYVHNDYNPANELGVNKIVLYKDSEILKENVILVDLPGVGSLTAENQKTTLDYVNKLAAGIFMIRTNPPITRTEKNFINALWPRLSNTIFVQNRWNDEFLEDVEDAKEHNEGVLNSIADAHHDDRNINVNVVNVYEAVKGKFEHDSSIYSESGIIPVINEIREISLKYNDNLKKALDKKLEEAVFNIDHRIQELMHASLNKSAQNELEKEKRIKDIKDILSYNKGYFRDIRNYAYKEMDSIIDKCSEIIRNNIDDLRTGLRRIINNGIVDGDILSSIYKESSDKAINNIMEEVLNVTGEFIKNLNVRLNYIKIKGFNGTYENISFFNKESSVKFEKSIPSILGLGSGVIGTMGTVGSLGGPLGILVGMSIGFVFSVIGNSIRKEILNVRADYTLKDLEPMIDDLENYLREEVLDDLRAKQEEIDQSIKNLRKKIENGFKDDIQNITDTYSKNYNDDHTVQFEKDRMLLNKLKKRYGMN